MRIRREVMPGLVSGLLVVSSHSPALAGNKRADKDEWRPARASVNDLFFRMAPDDKLAGVSFDHKRSELGHFEKPRTGRRFITRQSGGRTLSRPGASGAVTPETTIPTGKLPGTWALVDVGYGLLYRRHGSFI